MADRCPHFDYRNRFKAIGLVVVPLMANMVWKAGILRGFVHVGSVTLGSLALVLLVLVPLTNYSIGYFYYIYEVAALDFAASPKAYIIILIGAFLASRANLYLGWDFSGIMVPTLLALALLTPLRFVLTIVEAAVIVMVVHQVLKLPYLRSITWEGPRLVCFMFGASLLIKVITGHVVELVAPGFPYESLFAYGYLISTLIAVKMHQKRIFARISLPVATVSLSVVVFFHLVGQSMASLEANRFVVGEVDVLAAVQEQVPSVGSSPFEVMQQERSRILRPLRRSVMIELLPQESEQLRALVRLVADLSASVAQFDAAASWAAAVMVARDLRLELVRIEPGYADDHGYILLREPPDAAVRRGWGSFLFRIGGRNRQLVLVPRPLDEPGSMEVALTILKLLDGQALILPGAHHHVGDDGRADVLRRTTVPANVAAATLAHYTAIEVRLLQGGEGRQLWVAGALPPDLDLPALTAALPELPISFPPAPAPVENAVLRKVARPAYLTLAVRREDVQGLQQARYRQRAGTSQAAQLEVEEGGALRAGKLLLAELAATRPDLSRPVSLDQLVVWQQMVVAPLLALARESVSEVETRERLVPLAEVAQSHGWRLRLWRDLDDGLLAVLHEQPALAQAGGCFVLRLGDAEPWHMLAPLPDAVRDSAPAALALFLAGRGRLLSVGPQGQAVPGGPSPDRARRDLEQSLLHLMFQEAQQAWWQDGGLLGVEVLGTESLPGSAVSFLGGNGERTCLLRQANRIGGEAGLSEAARALAMGLRLQGLSVLVHDAGPVVQPYALSSNPQHAYAHAVDPGSHCGLWLDRETRQTLGSSLPSANRLQALEGLGLRRREVDMRREVPTWLDTVKPLPPSRELALAWSAIGEELRSYIGDRNLVRIEAVQGLAARHGMEVHLFHDVGSESLHLVLGFAVQGGLRQALCMNFEPLETGLVSASGDPEPAIAGHLSRRRAILQIAVGVATAVPEAETPTDGASPGTP